MRSDEDLLIDGLVQDLQPVAPMRFSIGFGRVALSALVSLALVSLSFGLDSALMQGQPSLFETIAQGLFVVLGLASASAVVAMGSPRVGGWTSGWIWALAMAAVLPLSTLAMAFRLWPQPTIPLSGHDLACMASGVGFGMLTALVLVLWLRRGAPVSITRAGLLTGIAAGAVGTSIYGLSCPDGNVYHIGIWHSLSVAICAVAGRLFVPRLIRW